MVQGYPLSSAECELLLAFESAPSLGELARVAGRDISVISRQLKRIADAAPVLEKVRGRWRLTALGRDLNGQTLESIAQQKSLLHRRRVLRVGATRTFGTKALAGNLDRLRDDDVTISLVTVEHGVEEALLGGAIDLGFSCGKPESPAIAFKRCAPERYVAAASPQFLRRHRVTDLASLARAPHLFLSTTKPFAELSGKIGNVYALYDDILATIEAARLGKGWGVFPWYAVAGQALKIIPYLTLQDEHYGVWWLRHRKSLASYAERSLELLRGLTL